MGGLSSVDLGADVLAISAGGYTSCALLVDHTVKCWGYNHSGQLGLGDANDRGTAPEQMGTSLPPLQLV